MLVANVLAEAVAGIREQNAEREGLVAENQRLREELGDRYRPGNIVGNCSTMQAIYQQIAQVADSTATVLIRGESGTGKELVARAIHYASSRRNNSARHRQLRRAAREPDRERAVRPRKGRLHRRDQRRKGRFELANGGTLFLDEIGDISPPSRCGCCACSRSGPSSASAATPPIT